MKGQVAANAVAIASLAREGFRPAGDLIFAATADEEVGDGFGLQWLCEEHPDAVRCDYAVNEGAGDRLDLGNGIYYICSTAEKLTAPFNVRVHGRSGHASMPGDRRQRAREGGAAHRAARGVSPRAGSCSRRSRRSCARCSARCRLPAPSSIARAPCIQIAAELVEPLLAPTFAPTMISASQKRNVIPALCEIVVDCRLLPGQSPEAVDGIVREVLGSDIAYDIDWLEAQGGTRSPLDTPLWDAVDAFVAESEPGARAVPICTAGFTDSHWLREAFGTVAYGFFPYRAMAPQVAAQLIHSADERVPVDDLELGLDWLRFAARAVLRLTVELRSLAELEPALAAEGFFERDDVFAHVYVGYRDSDALRRVGAAPPEPCPLPAVAYSIEPTARVRRAAGSFTVGDWRRSWTEAEYAAAVDAVRAAIAEGDVYQVNLVQHLSADFDGDPVGLAHALAPLRPLEPLPLVGRRLDDRLRLARAPALAARDVPCARRRSRGRGPPACRSSRRRTPRST